MWFLEKEVSKVSNRLDDKLSLGQSIDFLEQVIYELKKIIDKKGIVIMVIGDVAKSKNNLISPARELIRLITEKNIFNFAGLKKFVNYSCN